MRTSLGTIGLAFVVALGAAGCDGDEAAATAPLITPGLADCTGRPFTPPAPAGFDTFGGWLATLAGAPQHVAQDVIALPGTAPTVAVKLAYGAIWKDLEHERVAVYVDDCTSWTLAGTARSDDDGKATVALPSNLAVGAHAVRVVVRGDVTQAVTKAWVLPAGTHLAISDIDGTLTTDDGQLFQQLLDGSHVPAPYPAAVELSQAEAERGHVVVYLTGRPYWLLGITRAWLGALDFADGPVHVADSNAQILPLDASVGRYKRDWLAGLVAQGYVLDLAYGNATTDIYAYKGAGLPASATWIIGDHAGEQGTNPVTGSWAARAAEVEASPPVAQPF